MPEDMEPKRAVIEAPRTTSGTAVRRCTCQDAYQDDRYGPGKRLFNACQKGWRCTVCGREDSG
jgi:hypothetical protein